MAAIIIISFDLDDTLFVSLKDIKTEPDLKFPWNRMYKEKLRAGTVELFHKLQSMGIDTWIYTTSFRSESYIRSLFKHYGVNLSVIINGARHKAEVQGRKAEPMPSKYPAKYRIDLHVDDDVSVAQNGEIYGFRVHIIGPQDDEWAEKIINKMQMLKKIKDQQQVF